MTNHKYFGTEEIPVYPLPLGEGNATEVLHGTVFKVEELGKDGSYEGVTEGFKVCRNIAQTQYTLATYYWLRRTASRPADTSKHFRIESTDTPIGSLWAKGAFHLQKLDLHRSHMKSSIHELDQISLKFLYYKTDELSGGDTRVLAHCLYRFYFHLLMARVNADPTMPFVKWSESDSKITPYVISCSKDYLDTSGVDDFPFGLQTSDLTERMRDIFLREVLHEVPAGERLMNRWPELTGAFYDSIGQHWNVVAGPHLQKKRVLISKKDYAEYGFFHAEQDGHTPHTDAFTLKMDVEACVFKVDEQKVYDRMVDGKSYTDIKEKLDESLNRLQRDLDSISL